MSKTLTKIEPLIRSAADRAKWRQEHASSSYLADVELWRREIHKVADDQPQSLDDVDQLQQLIDRRGLSWDDFESDVETLRMFATPDTQRHLGDNWQAELVRLADADRDLREQVGATEFQLSELRRQLAVAEIQNRDFTLRRGQLLRIKASNSRVFADAANAFEGASCGVSDPTARPLGPETNFHVGR